MEKFVTNSCHFAKYDRKKWQIRLEPVESDFDIEFMQKEEQIDRQKDEFFEEKEKRESAKLAKKSDNNRELTNQRLSHDAAAGSRHSSVLPSCRNVNF